ncbi:MAG: hypothetical protein SGPRY_006963, partial [Prymnesium sp.]
PEWQRVAEELGTQADVSTVRAMQAMEPRAASKLAERELTRIITPLLQHVGATWREVAPSPFLSDGEVGEWVEAIHFAERSGAELSQQSFAWRIRNRPLLAAAWAPLRQRVVAKLRSLAASLPLLIVRREAKTVSFDGFDEHKFEETLIQCTDSLIPPHAAEGLSNPLLHSSRTRQSTSRTSVTHSDRLSRARGKHSTRRRLLARGATLRRLSTSAVHPSTISSLVSSRGGGPSSHPTRPRRRIPVYAMSAEERRRSELWSIHQRARIKLSGYIHLLERRASAAYIAAYQAVSHAHERRGGGGQNTAEARSLALKQEVLVVKLSADASAAYKDYKEIVSIRRRLKLPPHAQDEVALLLRSGGAEGEVRIVKLRKGRAVLRERTLAPSIPAFVRLLTDPYDLRFMWSELIECSRKITFAGIFMLLAQGTSVQLTMGLVVSVFFVVLYNNLKVYDSWQNDMLQQFCQLVVFLTLLGVFVLRLVDLALDADAASYRLVIGNGLIALVGVAAALGVVLIKLQVSDVSVRGLFNATIKRRQEARMRTRLTRVVIRGLQAVVHSDAQLRAHLEKLAAAQGEGGWRREVVRRLEGVSLAELEAAADEPRKFAMQQSPGGSTNPTLLHAKLTIVEALMGNHPEQKESPPTRPLTRSELIGGVVRHARRALRAETWRELPALIHRWVGSHTHSLSELGLEDAVGEFITMLVSTLRALEMGELVRAGQQPGSFLRKLLEESQGGYFSLEMQMLRLRWRMRNSLVSKGVQWADVELFLRSVEMEALKELVGLDPRSFWPRLQEELDKRIRGPLLRQLEQRLGVSGNAEYCRILDELSTEALEEIYWLTRSPKPLEQLLTATLCKHTKQPHEWLLDSLEPFASLDDLLTAQAHPLTFFSATLPGWLRHKYAGSLLASHSLRWWEAEAQLGRVEEMLREVTEDSDAFISRVAAEARRTRAFDQKRGEEPQITRLRPQLEPALSPLGLDWATDVRPSLREMMEEAAGELPGSMEPRELLLAMLCKQLDFAVPFGQARAGKGEGEQEGRGGKERTAALRLALADLSTAQLADGVLDTESFVTGRLAGEGSLSLLLLRWRALAQLRQLARSPSHLKRLEGALTQLCTVDELRAVVSQPADFVTRVADQPASRRLISQLEPWLGVGWERSVNAPIEEVVDSLERAGVREGRGGKEGEEGARTLLLALLRPQLRRSLEMEGVPLEDAMEVISEELTTSQLAEAVLDTESFVSTACAGAGGVASVLLRFRAMVLLLPLLQSAHQSELVGDALSRLPDAEALRMVVSDPSSFLNGLAPRDSAFEGLRGWLAPRLAAYGLGWEEEVVPIVLGMVEEGLLDEKSLQNTHTPPAQPLERMVLLRAVRPRLAHTLRLDSDVSLDRILWLMEEAPLSQLEAALVDTDTFVDQLTSTDSPQAYAELTHAIRQALGHSSMPGPSRLTRSPLPTADGGQPPSTPAAGEMQPLSYSDAGGSSLSKNGDSLLHRRMEPALSELGLEWEGEAAPAVEELISQRRLDESVHTEEGVRMVLLHLLRPQLARTLGLSGETVEQVLQVISEECSPHVLVDAVFDTEMFVDTALEAEDAVAAALARALKLPFDAPSCSALMQSAPSGSVSPPLEDGHFSGAILQAGRSERRLSGMTSI